MTTDKLAQLRAHFPPERVSWRVGSTTADKKRGMALCFIDSRDVQDRLDETVGPLNWQVRYPIIAEGKTICEIGIRTVELFTRMPETKPEKEWVWQEWIWKADGAGDSDIEAAKGAISDAFKRAGVKWGIGRYLYDLDSPWVTIEPAGKSFRIADSEMPRLRALLSKPVDSPLKQIAAAVAARPPLDDSLEAFRASYHAMLDQFPESFRAGVQQSIVKKFGDLRTLDPTRRVEVLEEMEKQIKGGAR